MQPKMKKWLILLFDKIDYGLRSSRIQVADFWNAELYTMKEDVHPQNYTAYSVLI